MKKTALFALLIAALAMVGCTKNSSGDPEMDRFVSKLMSKMTLEEKLGQLNLPVTGDIVTGSAQSSDVAGQIREGRVGGLFNLKGADKIREVQRIAVEESRLGIPLIFGMDVIHGYETIFPIPLGLSCCWDMDAIELSARIAAVEASADGISWTFSPMVDVCHDGRWGRQSEGNGEDPYLGSRIAEAMIRGYQGEDLTNNQTILSCVKHFALYGAPDAGRDYNTVDMSRYRMFNEYMQPYEAACKAGAGSYMASFNTIDGVPATGNRWLLNDLLREQWGFNGFVVSDYTGIFEMLAHGAAPDLEGVSALALHAGLDMDMVSDGLVNLADAVRAGRVDEADVDKACRRILEAKYKLGLFHDPYRYCDEGRRATDILTAEHRSEARRIARESMVLLKNENHTLPISKDQTVALIGPLAETRPNMSGTWAVAAVPQYYKTVREGLQDAMTGHGKLLYAKGSNICYDAKLEAIVTTFGREMRDARSAELMRQEALAIARQADVIVLAMGEASESSGECSSRVNLEMYDAQHDLMVELRKLGKPMVLVNFAGRSTVLNWENEHLDAILQAWFPGSETGDALADLLFGDYAPSGKLTCSMPRHVGQFPISYRQMNTGRPLGEVDEFYKFRSCYTDVKNSPLYAFGYGLSYVDFEYSPVTLSASEMPVKGQVEARVTVTNRGEMAADEIVQLYIRDLVSLPVRPTQELRGFERIHLEPGESREVTFTIDANTLAYYNEDLKWVCEAGEYQIMVGSSSDHVETLALHVK